MNGRLGLALLAISTAVACRTTHELGRFGDPETMAALDAASRGGSLQLVVPLEPKHGEYQQRFPVTSIGPEGLRWEPTPGEPTLIPPASVRSVSTFHAGRGALEGALIAGPPAFVVATIVAGLLEYSTERCVDGCDSFRGRLVLKVGALVGLGAAAIGAGFGAYTGHEHRYMVAH